jgi:hypothetical protein
VPDAYLSAMNVEEDESRWWEGRRTKQFRINSLVNGGHESGRTC